MEEKWGSKRLFSVASARRHPWEASHMIKHSPAEGKLVLGVDVMWFYTLQCHAVLSQSCIARSVTGAFLQLSRISARFNLYIVLRFPVISLFARRPDKCCIHFLDGNEREWDIKGGKSFFLTLLSNFNRHIFNKLEKKNEWPVWLLTFQCHIYNKCTNKVLAMYCYTHATFNRNICFTEIAFCSRTHKFHCTESLHSLFLSHTNTLQQTHVWMAYSACLCHITWYMANEQDECLFICWRLPS